MFTVKEWAHFARYASGTVLRSAEAHGIAALLESLDARVEMQAKVLREAEEEMERFSIMLAGIENEQFETRRVANETADDSQILRRDADNLLAAIREVLK